MAAPRDAHAILRVQWVRGCPAGGNARAVPRR